MKSKLSKSFIFDGLFLTAPLVLAAFLLQTFQQGSTSWFTPETFSAEMGPCALAISGLWMVMSGVAWALHQWQVTTVGQVLFLTPKPGRFWRWQLGITFVLTIIVSVQVTQVSWHELTDPDGLQGAWRLYQGLTHINWTLLPMATVAIVQTILLAFLATVLAIPLAFVLSIMSAKNVMTSPGAMTVYMTLRTMFNIVRSVEPLIWALIFTVWVGVGPFAGMLALLVHSIAGLAKQGSEIVEDVSLGPIEAIQSTGARPIQVVWFGILPQVILPFVSFAIYRWDSNVRMATVIGLVGGGGIGTLLIQYQGQAQWPEVGCIIFVVAVSVWLLDMASALVREALR